jgi:hypothetical protein
MNHRWKYTRGVWFLLKLWWNAKAIFLFLFLFAFAGCATIGEHRLPGFSVLILFIVLAAIVIVAGMAGGDDDRDL